MRSRWVPPTARLLARQLGFHRDPLRRRSDRVEGIVLLLVLVVGLLGLVLAGLSAARVHSYAERVAGAQNAERHLVQALVLTDAHPSLSDGSLAVVTATWPTSGSGWRVGPIEAAATARAGDHRMIWTDRSGTVVDRPMTQSDVLGLTMAAVLGVLLGTGLILLLVYRTVRWLLDRARWSDWDLDWAHTEPLWTKRLH